MIINLGIDLPYANNFQHIRLDNKIFGISRPSTSTKKKYSIKRQAVIKEYMRKQNITIVREFPLPSMWSSKKSGSRFHGSSFIDSINTVKKLEIKHEKEGVMRRNKLLLEQILNERLGDSVHNNI